MVDGELDRHGNGGRLRFRRRLSHPAERVWRALTEEDDLKAWFPQRITGEWKTGAPLRFEHNVEGVPGFDGEVIACDPPALLEYSWGPDVLRFEIEPDGAGCFLTLTDIFDEYGKAARDAAGWHVCLDVLGSVLDGAEVLPDTRERWAGVHAEYVEKFGPEAAEIGPPKGL